MKRKIFPIQFKTVSKRFGGFLRFFPTRRLLAGALVSVVVCFLIFLTVQAANRESFLKKIGRWFAQGKTAEIEEAISEKIKEDPGCIELYLELAALRKSQGDYDGAFAAYQNCLSRKKDWKVETALALSLLQMGRFENAEALLTGLYAGYPEDEDVILGLARLKMYQAKPEQNRFQPAPLKTLREAQQYLKKLTDLRPHIALYAWELAEVSMELGDRKTALRAYEKAVGRDASYKLAYRSIATLLAKEGKWGAALARYGQALKIQPDDFELRKEAGLIARLAPRAAERGHAARLKEWQEWVPSEEKPIAESPVTVRVGITTGLAELLFRGGSNLEIMTPAQTPLTVLNANTEYQVLYIPARRLPRKRAESWVVKDPNGKTLVTFSERIWIKPQDPQKTVQLHAVPSNTGYFFAREEDRAYRGVVEIAPRKRAGFTVINRISLEAYLAGVLPAEMPRSWPMEALKTQAIVARSYVLSTMGRHNNEGFDLCDDVHCEVYRGLRAENTRTNQAVNETAGVVLKSGNKYVPAVFSAQCGGHTQDYGEAWGHPNAVVGVADYEPRFNQDMEFPLSPYRLENWIRQERVAYCRFYGLGGYQNYRWEALISAHDVQKKLPGIGKLRRMIVTERSMAGWARRLLVEGAAGSKEIKGDAIRSFLGGVRSNLIWIEPQFNLDGWPQEFIIYGGGWGHGVGLCQVGCYGMAKAGKTCEEILKHYFPKAKIKRIAAD